MKKKFFFCFPFFGSFCRIFWVLSRFCLHFQWLLGNAIYVPLYLYVSINFSCCLLSSIRNLLPFFSSSSVYMRCQYMTFFFVEVFRISRIFRPSNIVIIFGSNALGTIENEKGIFFALYKTRRNDSVTTNFRHVT